MIGQAAMDQIHTLAQPKARALGAAINTEEAYLANFARWARPSLQTNKNYSPWQNEYHTIGSS